MGPGRGWMGLKSYILWLFFGKDKIRDGRGAGGRAGG